jgi:4-amino-4-deoxy-L-arabinose transferase-like glycosyltransferase
MKLAGEQLARVGEDRLRRWGPVALVLLTLIVLAPGSNLLPLMDRDEPRFAQASREMMERGEWIVPYFNGQYRLHKPILIYWLMRPCYAALGVTEFAARLPAIVCTALLVWLTFHVGARWFSAAAGFAAGFALLTCAQMLLVGRGALADMPTVLCVLASHWAMFELISDQSPRPLWRWWWLFWGAMGVGFLAKGPVAILLPGLTLAFYRLAFWRRPLPWRRLRAGLGAPVTLAIIAAWGIPALLRTQGEFYRVGIGHHVINRGLAPFEGHGSFAPHYYFVAALFSLFPWIAFAGDGLRAVRQGWGEKNAFLVSWVAGTYLVFTLYLTKLPHYVLPAFPALMLLLGQAALPGSKSGRWATVWFWLVETVAVTLATGLIVFAIAWRPEGALGELRVLCVAAAGILSSLAALALFWRRGRLALSCGAVMTLALSTLLLGASMRSMTPSLRVREFARSLPAETKCAAYRCGEPSLVFYTNLRWTEITNAVEAEAFMTEPGPRLLACYKSEIRLDDVFRKLTGKPAGESEAGPVVKGEGVTQTDLEGCNISHGSWVTLRLDYRAGQSR